MPMTTDSRHYLLPHTSPTAVAYRATPESAQQWQTDADAIYRTYREAHQKIADAWSETFSEALDGRVYPARPEHGEHIPAGARRGRWHWQLCPTAPYEVRLPYCHLIAHPGRCRGHAQAPDLRTRTGRAMQADLDTLEGMRDPFLDPDLLDGLPAGTPRSDAAGRHVGRASLLSRTVAPGSRYLVFETPPSPVPDPVLWEPVALEEYTAVRAEITGLL